MNKEIENFKSFGSQQITDFKSPNEPVISANKTVYKILSLSFSYNK